MGTEGPSEAQGKNAPKIYVYKHTHTYTHTHFYRYWPGVQDMPAKKVESTFYFLL